MKPNFALNLTDDSITLLQRTGRGWNPLGTVAFGGDDMDAALSALLTEATEKAPRGGVSTKLVIPNSQILYTTVTVTASTDAARRDEIRAALAGRTPYDVFDLAFDYEGEGPEVAVAVVAQETLDQAEDFAVARD
ncbi:MAG: translation initiation factor 2, partial [Rhodobacteraceae bacterium]|nr:translation initiation factor 2 [Paracoccaceae bacterium]